VVGVFPHAFEHDEDGVSVTWLEHFGGTITEQLAAARAAMGRVRRLRKSNRLAKLGVGKVVAAGRPIKKVIDAVHDPIDEPPDAQNTGHSLIVGISEDDDDLRNRIAMTISVRDLEEAVVP